MGHAAGVVLIACSPPDPVPPGPPARVDSGRCVLCGACVVACPELAIGLVPDVFGEASAVWVDEVRCTRCGTCEEACPELAIECAFQVILEEGRAT